MAKYRVGRKTGLVIITADGTKVIARCESKEIANEICLLLNKEELPPHVVKFRIEELEDRCEYLLTELEKIKGDDFI